MDTGPRSELPQREQRPTWYACMTWVSWSVWHGRWMPSSAYRNKIARALVGSGGKNHSGDVGASEREAMMQSLAFYLSPSALMDEEAPESWIFLDYQDDGRILTLPLRQFEATYRPGPEDQG